MPVNAAFANSCPSERGARKFGLAMPMSATSRSSATTTPVSSGRRERIERRPDRGSDPSGAMVAAARTP